MFQPTKLADELLRIFGVGHLEISKLVLEFTLENVITMYVVAFPGVEEEDERRMVYELKKIEGVKAKLVDDVKVLDDGTVVATPEGGKTWQPS